MESRIITKEMILAFGAYLRREERAASTVRKYIHDLTAFEKWLSGREVTKEAAAAWKAHLLDREDTPTTVNSSLAALHSFFSFVGWQECRVKYLKVQRKMFRDSSRDLTRESTMMASSAEGKNGAYQRPFLLRRAGKALYISPDLFRMSSGHLMGQ